jgi:hypothetical protein
MAARRQGKLDGMREAANAICRLCRRQRGLPVERAHIHGRWFHRINSLTEAPCKASAIYDLIAKGWGTSKPEGDQA